MGLVFAQQVTGRTINALIQFYISGLVYLVLIAIYAQLREQFASLHQLAHTDALTSLPNRRAMQARLEQELARSVRYQQPFAVLLIDLDHFKAVNDEYGHTIGDQVLREVSLRLNDTVRLNDVVARWGGEEFLVLAAGANLEQAAQLGRRLAEVIRNEPFTNSISLTISIGGAAYNKDGNLPGLISRADAALYEAKRAGRDRLELSTV
jgi:diguanylate cyclase (GGDEF)-like protein